MRHNHVHPIVEHFQVQGTIYSDPGHQFQSHAQWVSGNLRSFSVTKQLKVEIIKLQIQFRYWSLVIQSNCPGFIFSYMYEHDTSYTCSKYDTDFNQYRNDFVEIQIVDCMWKFILKKEKKRIREQDWYTWKCILLFQCLKRRKLLFVSRSWQYWRLI